MNIDELLLTPEEIQTSAGFTYYNIPLFTKVAEAQLAKVKKALEGQGNGLKLISDLEILSRTNKYHPTASLDWDFIWDILKAQLEADQKEVEALQNELAELRITNDSQADSIESLCDHIRELEEGQEATKAEAKQEGIKEVVEWLESHNLVLLSKDGTKSLRYSSDWQAQKDKWGVK